MRTKEFFRRTRAQRWQKIDHGKGRKPIRFSYKNSRKIRYVCDSGLLPLPFKRSRAEIALRFCVNFLKTAGTVWMSVYPGEDQ